MRFKRVLVATDFSDASRIAVSEAFPVCDAAASFEIVHVVPRQETVADLGSPVAKSRALAKMMSERTEEAEHKMAQFVKGLRLDAVAHRVLAGSIAEEIRSEAVSCRADLVVVGACRHAPAEHYFLGSKARALLWANAPQTSVFVGRTPRKPVRRPLRVGVATDFGSSARAAAERAASFLQSATVDVHLVHAVDPGVWLGETVIPVSPKTRGEPWTSVRTAAMGGLRTENARVFHGRAHEHLLVGDPSNALIQFARDERLDLLVIGTAGPHKEGPVVLGSIAADVSEKAQCSVLVVRS